MDNVRHAEGMFEERRKIIIDKRANNEFPDEEHPVATVVAAVIEPRKRPNKTEVSTRVEPSPSRALLPDNRHSSVAPSKPLVTLEDRRTAYANLQGLQFQVEKVIARLKKESDGCSRCIPELQNISKTLESCIPKLD